MTDSKGVDAKERVDALVKCVVVGDGAVGKTCLLIAYTTHEFAREYVPTIFDNFCSNLRVDGKLVSLGLWDTAGQEDYDHLRPLSYPNSDIVLVCFSVNSTPCFDNILSKWYPEVRKYIPTAPIIMVGTKGDLRQDPEALKRGGFVSAEDIEKMRVQIGAIKYVECSAVTQNGAALLYCVDALFEDAVRSALRRRRPHSRESCCTVL